MLQVHGVWRGRSGTLNSGVKYPVLFFFQAEDGIRDRDVTGVQTCALPIFRGLQLGAAVALVAVLAISRLRGWQRLIDRLPAGLRAGAAELAEMSWGGRLIAQIGRASCRERG